MFKKRRLQQPELTKKIAETLRNNNFEKVIPNENNTVSLKSNEVAIKIVKLFIDELPETELEVGGAGGWICEGKLRYRQEIINKYKK